MTRLWTNPNKQLTISAYTYDPDGYYTVYDQDTDIELSVETRSADKKKYLKISGDNDHVYTELDHQNVDELIEFLTSIKDQLD